MTAQTYDRTDEPPLDAEAARLGAAGRARRGARRLYRDGAKRLLDLALVLVMAAPVLVLVALLALLVSLDGSRPFYVQERVGRGGRVYRMWKMRSMVPDAEAALARHLAADEAARLEWDHHQKLRDDPRVTPLGRLLRRTSLDELPQLWNVVRGDMSLVGPRPTVAFQVAAYDARQRGRLRARPGLTGLAQVRGRAGIPWSERIEIDLEYVARQSLRLDLAILARTVVVVLRRRGTYKGPRGGFDLPLPGPDRH